ncbi:hypothetical protein Pcinc_025908 [Petrolisthes cinctipes]|uniref:Acylglycerol kinase, mitochondrial n=1 Tax=Petrolisthes cinctipes TaxID=88211 RepID=A0AAE1F731_PETCI|nr:hypothetical protein Pcinc_025908 [Petrolisthes cinctipes]
MERVTKFIGVLRRNPKKSLVFSGVLGYGVNYVKVKNEEREMMRMLCKEALAYGEMPKNLGEPDRHITVLLNPAAKGGKGKTEFDRYCAPLLHLAGIKVATVRTEHEGQARDLMEVMDNTTAVVVAGGDGTLAEVLTGLLRRVDNEDASRRFPLGILPLGNNNTALSAIWGFRGQPKPLHLAEATMAIVRDIKRPLDVMEILPFQDAEKTVPGKPVYAVSGINWGAYRDASERKDIYWYWSVLKKYLTYVFSSYKDLSWDCSAELEYTNPCSGCSRCRAQSSWDDTAQTNKPEPPRRWWMAYIPKTRPVQEPRQEERIDYSSIINEACGKLERKTVLNTSDVTVQSRNTPESEDIPGYALSVKTGPSNVGAFEFIQEGWRREWSNVRTVAEELIVGEVTLKPTGKTTTEEGKDRELNIDNEAFEVRPMRIRARPSAVTIFAPANPPFAASVGLYFEKLKYAAIKSFINRDIFIESYTGAFYGYLISHSFIIGTKLELRVGRSGEHHGGLKCDDSQRTRVLPPLEQLPLQPCVSAGWI